MYLYEAIISKINEPQFKGYMVDFPDFDTSTCGATIEEASYMAHDLLKTEIAFALTEGEKLPKATFGHKTKPNETVVLVSVEVTQGEASERFPHKEAALN